MDFDILISQIAEWGKTNIEEEFGGYQILLFIPFILFIGLVAKWKLFIKGGHSFKKSGYGALLPVYDFLLTLDMVGRPRSHGWFLLIPVFNVFFIVKVLLELIQSFGKTTALDYVLLLFCNILYLLNLGLAYNETYRGPVYGKSVKEIRSMKPQLA